MLREQNKPKKSLMDQKRMFTRLSKRQKKSTSM